ncbi:MAG: BadF/BadG/BcrA/BcrD ATPase family protein [Candidatus Baltobacteraceae bacterium]
MHGVVGVDAGASHTVAAIAVGTAGAGTPEMQQAMAAALAGRFPGTRIVVTDDASIALRAAIPHGDGFLLIAGTGSIAFAEIQGVARRAGGYGYLLGDEGSGFAIGAAALALMLRVFEGRARREPMAAALAKRIDAQNPRDAIARIYQSPAPVAAIAACAPLVLEHAARGEPGARKIVQRAALELFELLSGIAKGLEDDSLPLAFSGGLLRSNNLLTYLLETRIANEFPNLCVVKSAAEPYLGALVRARGLLANA